MESPDRLSLLIDLSRHNAPEIRELLDRLYAAAPEYRDDPDFVWFEWVLRAHIVIEETGSVPSRVGATRATDVGRWVNKQRERYRKGSLDRRQVSILDRMAPGWDVVVSSNPAVNFLNATSEYRQWREDHGRAPRSNARDSDERRLAEWLLSQRAVLERGKMSVLHVAELDRLSKTWRKGIRINR